MSTAEVDLQTQLDEPYPLTAGHVEQFQRDGFIKLKDVLSPEVIEHFASEITRLTLANNRNRDKPLAERDTYGQAFIQVGNLWTKSDEAKRFAFAKRVARIAAELLRAPGVRMWHDQALYKEPGGGFTPWHVDQQYWPMASSKSVTAWMPLQAVPMEMGPLCFGRGSHLKNIGRELAISDESERIIREEIKREGLLEVFEPYELGEVSFHYGWTLHRAGPNTTDRPRCVHTVIYMERDMRLAEPRNENQRRDWAGWTPSTQVGEVMDDALNPVLWEERG
ncbi:MAG: phytanoyl-CoA dioxygenase family protein [Phycisphaeraceae bacterium]